MPEIQYAPFKPGRYFYSSSKFLTRNLILAHFACVRMNARHPISPTLHLTLMSLQVRRSKKIPIHTLTHTFDHILDFKICALSCQIMIPYILIKFGFSPLAAPVCCTRSCTSDVRLCTSSTNILTAECANVLALPAFDCNQWIDGSAPSSSCLTPANAFCRSTSVPAARLLGQYR